MCLYPKLIRNKKYQKTKKNGGNVPPIHDTRTLYVPVGCQQCVECRKQKARQWQIRMLEDIKENTNGKFITLTFSNKSILELTKELGQLKGYTLDNATATLAVRRFLERHRKKYGKSIRHWLVTELGHNGTENIHLHGIVWSDLPMEEIERIWEYGFMWKGKPRAVKGGKTEWINYVNEKTVTYITKYVSKKDEKHPNYKAIILTSPGIGGNYTERVRGDWERNKFNGEETQETYRTTTGHKIALPIYWRNKIYNDEEKEKLWIIKLNKNERWVRGEKYDITETMEGYYKAVKWHRQLNKELGYGDGEINYDQKEYEEKARMMKQQERIQAALKSKKIQEERDRIIRKIKEM